MIEIEDLTDAEISDLLMRVGYGHLACCQDDRPYVVPVHYAYDGISIFIYTTEGKKFEIIRHNPNVCLQVEEVVDNRHWLSAVIDGIAIGLTHGPERGRALELVVSANPTLTPAVSIRWMDDWVRENIEVIYRITPTMTSGRRSVDRTGSLPFIPGGSDRGNKTIL